jgi:hypothetical protein
LADEKNLTPLRSSIIRTLAYYDIFSYPLTAAEIFYNLGSNHTNLDEIKNELKNLSSYNIIYSKEEFFQLTDDEKYILRRKKGNELAKRRLKTAKKVSDLISRFPFIRGILLSGSISKSFMEEESDIDYFIITHPNRVWISRLILMLFKKLFLFNSKKIFCINYFVDSEKLEIEEKNIFTATEIVTLLPTYGKKIYDEFYEKNYWVKEFYPNYPKRETGNVIDRKDGIVKNFLEKILSKNIGDKIDDFAMSVFEKFNRIKYKNYGNEEFKIAFKSSKKESKHHPKFFQRRVLEEFNRKLELLEDRLKVSL